MILSRTALAFLVIIFFYFITSFSTLFQMMILVYLTHYFRRWSLHWNLWRVKEGLHLAVIQSDMGAMWGVRRRTHGGYWDRCSELRVWLSGLCGLLVAQSRRGLLGPLILDLDYELYYFSYHLLLLLFYYPMLWRNIVMLIMLRNECYVTSLVSCYIDCFSAIALLVVPNSNLITRSKIIIADWLLTHWMLLTWALVTAHLGIVCRVCEVCGRAVRCSHAIAGCGASVRHARLPGDASHHPSE